MANQKAKAEKNTEGQYEKRYPYAHEDAAAELRLSCKTVARGFIEHDESYSEDDGYGPRLRE